MSLSSALSRGSAACLLSLLYAPTAFAQAPKPAAPPADAPAFLTRSDFSFLGGFFKTPDPRFTYDAQIGADLDLVDYGAGRTNLLVNYEMVVGNERRTFDVNHGNYTIALSTSLRAGPVEVAGFFHHVSRHLADRENPNAVSWNVIGARVEKRVIVRRTTVDWDVDAGQVVTPAFVDYTWIGNAHAVASRPIASSASLFASGIVTVYGVDRDKAGRGRQTTERGEAGLRLTGQKGVVDVFAAYERRADAYPIERAKITLVTFGLRIQTK
jgi:hypothetical protein